MAPDPISPRITDLLSQLRRKIRRYVCLQGLAVAIAWMISTFWISTAIDYLPVRLGANEMPVPARATLLVLASLALLFILYWYIIRRTLVTLRPRSLAILIERAYPEFQDSLVTTVERQTRSASQSKKNIPENPDDQDDDAGDLRETMLRSAHDKALQHLDHVRLGKVFNYQPLRRALMVAAVAVGSVIFAALVAFPSLKMWAARIYGLSPDPYPRLTHLELEGFQNDQLIVARGANITLHVRSNAKGPVPPPDVCTIYYETESGQRGRANMSKQGTPRNGFQNYTFDGKPFKSILGAIQFDIVGNDQRIRNQRVKVVDSPQVASISIECQRPAYTELSRTQWEYYPGIQIPQGSHLELKLKVNKPVVHATWQTSKDDQPILLKSDKDDPASVSLTIENLDQSISQEISLLDTDGISSKRPYRIAIAAIPDEAPTIQIRMSGIGSAITPDARIPISGSIGDDYGVARSWFEIQLPSDPDATRQFDLFPDSGEIEAALDLRDERSRPNNPFELTLDSRIVFSVKSADHYNLQPSPNVGESDRYELDVVDASRLIALLEARELGLRRRLDQIINELKETRDSLARVQFAPSVDQESTLADDATGTLSAQERIERAATLRLLRVQRGEQHSQRATQEIAGVALSFDDIRQELINNRVDATDRRNRIENDIVKPLSSIVDQMFPVLDGRLERLRMHLEEARPEDEIRAASVATVTQVDQILIQLEAVLEKMLELETYNELVELVRKMIRDQEDLTERTKEQQKKSALDLLN